MKRIKREIEDPYLDDLKIEFKRYSSELKQLKQKLLKSNSNSERLEFIHKMDLISTKMENNQKQASKVTKSRLKDMKKNNKKRY